MSFTLPSAAAKITTAEINLDAMRTTEKAASEYLEDITPRTPESPFGLEVARLLFEHSGMQPNDTYGAFEKLVSPVGSNGPSYSNDKTLSFTFWNSSQESLAKGYTAYRQSSGWNHSDMQFKEWESRQVINPVVKDPKTGLEFTHRSRYPFLLPENVPAPLLHEGSEHEVLVMAGSFLKFATNAEVFKIERNFRLAQHIKNAGNVLGRYIETGFMGPL